MRHEAALLGLLSPFTFLRDVRLTHVVNALALAYVGHADSATADVEIVDYH